MTVSLPSLAEGVQRGMRRSADRERHGNRQEPADEIRDEQALLAPAVLRRLVDCHVTTSPAGGGPDLSELTERELEVLALI
jgi:ATP/maltotriose-dependent transcriptional regulator MalT